MTLVLPEFVGGSATGWQLLDYVSRPFRSQPATAGAAQIELAELDSDEMWLVDHAVVNCSSTTPTQLRWYDSVVDPAALLDGSNAGNFDVADWPAGLQLGPSTRLLVRWTGASDGAIGTLTLQARVLRRR